LKEDDEDNGGEGLDSTPSFKHRQRLRRTTGRVDKWEHRKEKINGVSLVTSVTLSRGTHNMFHFTIFITEKNPIRFGSTPKSRIDGFSSVP
jgi:hypothetical protein